MFVVIVLQFLYLVYNDYQNRKEREGLELKLMSKDVTEYKNSTEKIEENTEKEEEDPYLTMEEAGVEGVLRAK